ncbi:N-alpha-acetyltransferase 38, NatC auxiliary subunit isoform X1 [Ixodes scapularis]|nr:N-alpha-acetyltransferase 38, NatC auxiliary subunit isoform X1 [Ixodes scapularis]
MWLSNDQRPAYCASRERLQQWLNKSMKIEMSDGRTLIGTFLCTDRDQNVILGSCSEFLKPEENGTTVEPRILGLAMVPGQHIMSIHIDDTSQGYCDSKGPL